ncbi:SulP family inorganic anion transporter [Marinihelvus fidelis]|nr:SulP family inorganic anion transporter [Marinihelvus fidelis]
MNWIQRRGYVSKTPFSDGVLGLFDGLDSALWCYGFATILFAGSMTAYLPVAVMAILVGWGLLAIFVALTSGLNVHVTNIDEQAVVILAGLGVSLVAAKGGAGPESLATLLALTSVSAVLVAVGFLVAGRFRAARVLELLPFPVICGFMAGVAWLLVNAAVLVTVDVPISSALPEKLAVGEDLAKLLAALGCGVFLSVFVGRVRRVWAFPAAALLIFIGFYAVTRWLGMDQQALLAGGWLFDVSGNGSSVMETLAGLSFSDIDFGFILGSLPELLTIVFLALLSASMSLTALSSSQKVDVDGSAEIEGQGLGNLLCAVVACPPGYTDVAGSSIYARFGVSSRWVGLVSGIVCLLIAAFGGQLISYLPKVLVGATIFLFAYQLAYEWLFQRIRGFQPVDFLVVCIILAMVIFVGFMVGIVTGIVLTLVLFVLRYSMISAIHGRYTLREYRSSVERPPSVNLALDRVGRGSLVYTLRGFLFFGTANHVFQRIKEDLADENEEHLAVLLDFKRVTGIDISALNTFVQVRQFCEDRGIQLLYSDVPMASQFQISSLNAVSLEEDSPLFFEDMDYAVEYIEELVLRHADPSAIRMTVREQLEQILESEDRIELIMHALQRVECAEGDSLFAQGDRDNGFYILESGALSAYIDQHGAQHRVKKFGPGSLIGELSMFIPGKRRTATVTADAPSVLYFMSSEVLSAADLRDSRLAAAVNELIARALGMRIDYMNQRLMLELD